jgi:hypothetical protein
MNQPAVISATTTKQGHVSSFGGMNQEHRNEIDRLVNIFLTALTSLSNDAGWTGDSLLSRVIEFAGCPPRGTGMDLSNAAMINHIRHLHKTHPEFARIQRAIRCALKFNAEKTHALLAKHYYQGLTSLDGPAFTDERRAAMVGQTYQAYRNNVVRAYPVIQEELDRVDMIAGLDYALSA